MGIAVSIIAVYPAHVDFWEGLVPEIERILGTQIRHEPRTAVVGSTGSCLVNVELPDSFDVRRLSAQMAERLPDVNVNTPTSFRRSIWEWRGLDVVIATTSGIAVALVLDALQLLTRP